MMLKQIDTEKVKKELKNCPLIIRQYVKSLEYSNEYKQELLNKAINKIKELSK
jgi:hypothetical protein